MVKKLLEHFMEKKKKNTNQQKFRIEKVIKKKADNLYAKWNCYDLIE